MTAQEPARIAGVHVIDPVTQLPTFYDVDDEVAPEHVSLIGDHVWTSGKRPASGAPEDEGSDRPAKSAVKADHLAYAAKVSATIDGKPVTDSATVEEIIAAYDAAKQAGAGGSGA